MIADEPLQTPLVNKFLTMELVPNSKRKLDFNQSLQQVFAEEEQKEGLDLFTNHNPSSSFLFKDS